MLRWKYDITKDAQSFSDDGATFTLQNGKTPTHAVRAWNNANPTRRISLRELLDANPGVDVRRYIAGKKYNMPSSARMPTPTSRPVPMPTEERSAHPDRRISLKALLEANPGVDPKRYIADKKYKMPSIAPITTATQAKGKPGVNADQLLAQINAAIDDTVPFTQTWEKYEPEAYWDSIGNKWTVGHGHTQIRDASTGKMRPVRKGDTLTESDSTALTKRIMRQNAADIYKNLKWFRRLNQASMSAVLDKAYNAGWGVFSPKKSPTLTSKMSIPGADPNDAYWSEHDTYTSAGGNKNVPGLVNRQKAARKKWNPSSTRSGTNVR